MLGSLRQALKTLGRWMGEMLLLEAAFALCAAVGFAFWAFFKYSPDMVLLVFIGFVGAAIVVGLIGVLIGMVQDAREDPRSALNALKAYGLIAAFLFVFGFWRPWV
jgi:type III secretory pathway component EscS